jgi:predicted MFS family arabinose efflux permease
MALGINGMFGGFGPAAAALMSGVLIDWLGWRAAFIVPGAAIIATGLVFWGLVMRGDIIESKADIRAEPPVSRKDAIRVGIVLLLTMVCNGMIYQATQAGLPKLFSIRVADFASDGAFGISALVAVAYGIAGVLQIFSGRLADRYPLKTVYQIAFLLQVPLLLLASQVSGPTVVLVAILMVTANVGSLPAENCLVARYSPSHRRGLAYGLKFVFAIGIASGFGVKLEGLLFDASGNFVWLFTVLAALAAGAAAIGFLLPGEPKRQPAPPVPVAAE